jgi:GntR family transcriptional regulator
MAIMADSALNQWQVEYKSGIPVYRQIINQASAAVEAGNLKAGDQLPTIRSLSERLNVNPNTVAKAYRELELKGIIVSERGSGSFIQASAEAPGAREKKTKLKSLYHRLLADALSSGLTESELLNYIQERKTSVL